MGDDVGNPCSSRMVGAFTGPAAWTAADHSFCTHQKNGNQQRLNLTLEVLLFLFFLMRENNFRHVTLAMCVSLIQVMTDAFLK